MTPIVFLPVILILILVASYLHPLRRELDAPDCPSRFGRILCGVAFVSALAAVAVGTWRGTTGALAFPEVRLKVPTRVPLPIPNMDGKPSGKIDIGPCRIIATVLLVVREQDRVYPMCGDSYLVEWPAIPNMIFRGKYNGANYEVTLNLRDFLKSGATGAIEAQDCLKIVTNGPAWSSMSNGNLALDSLRTESFGNGQLSRYHAPLSLIPTYNGQARILIHLTRADSDDPVETIPASEWLARDVKDVDWSEQLIHPTGTPYYDVPYASPGIYMLAFLGPASSLLLIAAIAGSICVRSGRRGYAFVGLLVVMILYAGLLDAMVLRHRAGLTTDARQPEYVREMALVAMYQGTFFHTENAMSRIREIAGNRANPESLRKLAGAIAGPALESP